MSKRAASPSRSSPNKAHVDNTRTAYRSSSADPEDEAGEFEDAFEDEFEDEDDVVDQNDYEQDDDDNGDTQMMANGVDSMALQEERRSASPVPYLPQFGQGEQLGEDEELVPDMSSYVVLEKTGVNWPCLSFDILRDNAGPSRLKPAHSTCLVAGTQAGATGGAASANEVLVMKWENLNKAKNDQDSEDEHSDDDDDHVDEDPILTYRSIPHHGGVNRIRARKLASDSSPPQPPSQYHVASFSETGKVHIYDVAPHLYSLEFPKEAGSASTLPKAPIYTVNSHGRAEGFALDWSSASGTSNTLRLLSGDIHSKIYLTTVGESDITPSSQPFSSHTSSIEDIQWSPSEATVFASCSADQSWRVWDVRLKERKSVINVNGAHPADINVMSWNPKETHLMLTGGDEGGIKVWDLRHLKSARSGSKPPAASPLASFNWHKAPITSVEWHPTEDSSFAASCADDSVTLWDLAVEADDEETGAKENDNIPAQLLFVHQGQKEIKEIHWHPQIPGMVISTALDGFNVFKTISI